MSDCPMDWNPASPASVEERFAQMDEMRGRCPVAYASRHGGQWDLLRYQDIAAVAQDPGRFSNAGDARYGKPLPPLEMDPPIHTYYRRLLAVFFSPKKLLGLEQVVRGVAAGMVTDLVSAGGGDLARDYAYPLPAIGLCALLNIPSDRWRDIKIWSENTLLRDSEDPADQQLAMDGHNLIIEFAMTMIAERRKSPLSPEEDLTSALLSATVDGETPDDDPIARTLRILISAGHNSTTSAIGNTLLYLAQNLDAQARLRADPALIPAAVEEMLRIETPVQEMPRWAKEDVEIGGRSIPKGGRIGLFFGAGNRDEAAFEKAGEVMLDRKPNRHLAFGVGIHTCLGAPMARMEARVALEEVLARTSSFTLAGPVIRPAFHRMGVVSLPAAMTPAG